MKEKKRTIRGIPAGDIRRWGKGVPNSDPDSTHNSFKIHIETLFALSSDGPPRVVLDPVGKCIYCGSTETLTMEHIIPFSLGGKFELPESSCKECSLITMKLEQFVTRNYLRIPRSLLRIRTRRPRERVTLVAVELHHHDGSVSSADVEINEAPTANLIPNFIRINERVKPGDLLAKATIEQKLDHEFIEKHKALIAKFGVKRIIYKSPPLQVELFVQMLWKIAYGFLYVAARKSAIASGRAATALGKDSPPLCVTSKNYIGLEEGALAFVDIVSVPSRTTPLRYGLASVWRKTEGGKNFINCQLTIMNILGFPNYILRIPDVEESRIEPVHFRLKLWE